MFEFDSQEAVYGAKLEALQGFCAAIVGALQGEDLDVTENMIDEALILATLVNHLESGDNMLDQLNYAVIMFIHNVRGAQTTQDDGQYFYDVHVSDLLTSINEWADDVQES